MSTDGANGAGRTGRAGRAEFQAMAAIARRQYSHVTTAQATECMPRHRLRALVDGGVLVLELAPTERSLRHGIPTTSAVRTLYDLVRGGSLHESVLAASMDELIRNGRLSADDLRALQVDATMRRLRVPPDPTAVRPGPTPRRRLGRHGLGGRPYHLGALPSRRHPFGRWGHGPAPFTARRMTGRTG